MRISRAALSLLMVTALAPMATTLHAQDENVAGRWAGVWAFVPEESKFPDAPNVVDDVLIKHDGTTIIHEWNGKSPVRDWSYKPAYGQAAPVYGHGDNVTVTVTRPNPDRLEQVWDYNGKPGKSFAELSKDGNTQTFHVFRTKDGQPFEEIIIFRRVRL